MAQIVDYASLKSYVTDTLDRSGDSAFVAQLDAFIGLAEDSWTPTLLSRRMEATADLTTADDGSVDLPADFYKMRALSAVFGINVNLPMISPVAEPGLYPLPSNGTPARFAKIVGTKLYVLPEQPITVTLDYWAKFVGLSSGMPTNWIILNHPTLYLYSTMAQAYFWLQDMTNAANLEAKAQATLDNINSSFAREYYSNTDLVLDTPTP